MVKYQTETDTRNKTVIYTFEDDFPVNEFCYELYEMADEAGFSCQLIQFWVVNRHLTIAFDEQSHFTFPKFLKTMKNFIENYDPTIPTQIEQMRLEIAEIQKKIDALKESRLVVD